MKKATAALILFLTLATAAQPALGMSTVKGWINKIRPGTFETADTTADTQEEKSRKFTEAEVKVLTELAKREAELKKKEALHRQRAADLKSLSQQIEQKLDQIRKLTAEFEAKRQKRKEMDEKDVSRMVKYYETMDPERAAIFVNQMDRVTATHILKRMNPRKASNVMELLDPKVAVEITEMLTQFKADRQSLAEN